MAEQLTKLRPDRDLQCYFQQPSAVAALSETSASGFTVSGSWRQQFDWAVVDWSRDNVFEHPALRKLPDGDLRGVRLSYEETRANCIAMDSTTFDTIGWQYLRVWEESGGAEIVHWVPLRRYATAVEGAYVQPTATFELGGAPTIGDCVELGWLDQHANYCVGPGDTLESIAAGLAGFINGHPAAEMQAVVNGRRLTLTYNGALGANGNRVGVYGGVSGARSETWSPSWAMFGGGRSPERWRVDLDFDDLIDTNDEAVPVANVRRLRWTWAAGWQAQEFQRSDFAVVVSNWTVTGATPYRVAGPGSRRIEDDGAEVSYAGSWLEDRGNYSGGSIRYTNVPANAVQCSYDIGVEHELYLGTRYLDDGGHVQVEVDGAAVGGFDLKRGQEDVLVRLPLGSIAAGPHTVRVVHDGDLGTRVYFDFLEIALPTASLPDFEVEPRTTLATDWDTDHSLAIAPERTAWLIHKLGFHGRANHYMGAMWFYELWRPESRCASMAIEFSGTPEWGGWTEVTLSGYPIRHVHYITDTAETVAKCFELQINAGSPWLWAEAEGSTLRITARAMGEQGNAYAIGTSTSGGFVVTRSGDECSGGVDGKWFTDLDAMPRLNRAARDWCRSYFRALASYGIDLAAAFSMELRDGDDRQEVGIAQRYPDVACHVSTPALQTNFGPRSTAFWEQVYGDMAGVMTEAGVQPYLQFGEVQWWYFANAHGMPFYDAYTEARFTDAYGRPMGLIASEASDPAGFPEECELLPKLIGEFTTAVIAFVRGEYPDARFEVLYPPDTNDTPLNRVVNFPRGDWTAEQLACLKTENFTFTGNRNLDQARASILMPTEAGFPRSVISHLVGINDPTWPWMKEWQLSLAEGVESVVLFALDQFCLVGYALPLDRGGRRALYLGA